MKESPLFNKTWNKNINSLAIVYPNLYYGGVYCLAPLIFYNIVNQQKNWLCDRYFLDKKLNLNNYDLIGFTFQYELDIYNIKKITKEYNLKNKITFAGGPCININPKLLTKLVDFVVIGEIEELLVQILKIYEKTKNKGLFLKGISKLNGVYTKNSKKITSTEIKDLNKIPYPLLQPFPETIDKNFTFGKVFILEIERGCPFNCKFCPIKTFYKKVKIRSLEKIKEIIDKGTKINQRDKIVIYSPSFTHPDKKEILKYIIKKSLKASVPSLKPEIVDKELLQLIKKAGQKTITIAPECGQTLRKTTGKFVTDQQIINFTKLTSQLDFSTIKLYFLVGLPNQNEKDLNEIIDLINKIKENFKNRVYISINPFVPKPKTEFKIHKFNKSIIKKQINYLKKHLKVKFKYSNINTSQTEWKIAFNKQFIYD